MMPILTTVCMPILPTYAWPVYFVLTYFRNLYLAKI